MKTPVLLIVCLGLAVATTALQAQTSATIPGDFADPSIIRVKDTYYATVTFSEWAPHFPIYTSKDLKSWK